LKLDFNWVLPSDRAVECDVAEAYEHIQNRAGMRGWVTEELMVLAVTVPYLAEHHHGVSVYSLGDREQIAIIYSLTGRSHEDEQLELGLSRRGGTEQIYLKRVVTPCDSGEHQTACGELPTHRCTLQ
jgi:hypothetical protein